MKDEDGRLNCVMPDLEQFKGPPLPFCWVRPCTGFREPCFKL